MRTEGENRVIKTRDGTQIAYTKAGSGPAVILVDGAFCYRENGPSSGLASLLAQDFMVFTYDRRGRGESTDTKPYSLIREVEDLQSILEEAGGSAYIVGISSGAALALQLAASDPRAKKLALYEPPYVDAKAGSKPLSVLKSELQQLVLQGRNGDAVKFFMSEVMGIPKIFVVIMRALMRGIWRKNESVAATLAYDLELLEDRSVFKERGSLIAAPTLVIGGAKSPEVLRDAVAMVATSLPNARSQLLENQSHNFSAKALAPIVRNFFLN